MSIVDAFCWFMSSWDGKYLQIVENPAERIPGQALRRSSHGKDCGACIASQFPALILKMVKSEARFATVVACGRLIKRVALLISIAFFLSSRRFAVSIIVCCAHRFPLYGASLSL